MQIKKKRIFGTQCYIRNDGHVVDSEGNKLIIKKSHLSNDYVVIGKKRYSIPKLVLESFSVKSTKYILHLDGDKHNNSLWNLIYVDHPTMDGYFHVKKMLDETPDKVVKLREILEETDYDIETTAEIMRMKPALIVNFIRHQKYIGEKLDKS